MNCLYSFEYLLSHLEKHFIDIKPSEIPKDILKLIPKEIYKTMTNASRRDITELYECYRHQLWTACSLMAYRVLEEALRIHISEVHGEESFEGLGHSLEILIEQGYPKVFIERIDELRRDRNSFMHGKRRASIQNTQWLVGYVVTLTLQIHNIIPD